MPRYRYRQDPHWLEIASPARCAGCGAQLERGARVFWFPLTGGLFGNDCGCGPREAREFEAAAQDEEFFNG